MVSGGGLARLGEDKVRVCLCGQGTCPDRCKLASIHEEVVSCARMALQNGGDVKCEK